MGTIDFYVKTRAFLVTNWPPFWTTSELKCREPDLGVWLSQNHTNSRPRLLPICFHGSFWSFYPNIKKPATH